MNLTRSPCTDSPHLPILSATWPPWTPLRLLIAFPSRPPSGSQILQHQHVKFSPSTVVFRSPQIFLAFKRRPLLHLLDRVSWVVTRGNLVTWSAPLCTECAALSSLTEPNNPTLPSPRHLRRAMLIRFLSVSTTLAKFGMRLARSSFSCKPFGMSNLWRPPPTGSALSSVTFSWPSRRGETKPQDQQPLPQIFPKLRANNARNLAQPYVGHPSATSLRGQANLPRASTLLPWLCYVPPHCFL